MLSRRIALWSASLALVAGVAPVWAEWIPPVDLHGSGKVTGLALSSALSGVLLLLGAGALRRLRSHPAAARAWFLAAAFVWPSVFALIWGLAEPRWSRGGPEVKGLLDPLFTYPVMYGLLLSPLVTPLFLVATGAAWRAAVVDRREGARRAAEMRPAGGLLAHPRE